MDKIKSRKLWVGILTGVIVALGEQFGLSDTAKVIVGMIGGSYIGGQGVADAGAQAYIKSFKDKLVSRKLWFTVASVAITVAGNHFGMSEVSTWIIGALASTFNVGQGIADSKAVAIRAVPVDPEAHNFGMEPQHEI